MNGDCYTSTLIVGFIVFGVTGLGLMFYWGPQIEEEMVAISRDFVTTIPDNQTIVMTSYNNDNSFSSTLFWNQVNVFVSQGWTLNNTKIIDEEHDKTVVTLVR